MTPDDTIAAIASAPGGAGRGIIRVSGPGTLASLSQCFRAAAGESLGAVRRPTVVSGNLQLGAWKRTLPCDIFLWPSQRSYTRQPTAELHTIGSPPLLRAALDEVCRCGARLAEPGEFTMRAFLAGRLDLTQAEAVLGVIDALDRRQLDIALKQLAGGLAGPLRGLRSELLELLAHLEAGLDFVDEDIEFIGAAQLVAQLEHAMELVADLRKQMITRGTEAGEPRVVLHGRPNVGKSSLLNALVQGRAALVTGTPGTTRDYLCRRLELNGLACVVIDTAGVAVKAGDNPVGAKAQEVTAEQSRQADVRVLCLDATRAPDAWEREQIEYSRGRAGDMAVLTKCDLARLDNSLAGHLPATLRTSSKTLHGVDNLRQAIRSRVEALAHSETGVVAGTADRCQDSLRQAEKSLIRARELAADRWGEELVAAEVRGALTEVGKVVGDVYTDDVLDRIFSRFCIGK